jgi:hypothetical protein
MICCCFACSARPSSHFSWKRDPSPPTLTPRHRGPRSAFLGIATEGEGGLCLVVDDSLLVVDVAARVTLMRKVKTLRPAPAL